MLQTMTVRAQEDLVHNASGRMVGGLGLADYSAAVEVDSENAVTRAPWTRLRGTNGSPTARP